MTEQSKSESAFSLHGVKRIVSGGQTGVDQAALDAAIELKIPHGGWCPKGRLCEIGRIPAKYKLKELPIPDYAARTLQNVIDSDGTLILYRGRIQGGTALTVRYAREQNKPILRVQLEKAANFANIVRWIEENKIQILNVAGPRASTDPEIHRLAKEFLMALARYQGTTRTEIFEAPVQPSFPPAKGT